jgi:tetratricopeptide (TPR) repeat protein
VPGSVCRNLLRKLGRFEEARAAFEDLVATQADGIYRRRVRRKPARRQCRPDLIHAPTERNRATPLPAQVTSALLSSVPPRVVASMTLLSMSDKRAKAEGLITRVVDRVFGYDFFLSYSRADGMRLPHRLKERLEQAGFRVFLDQTEYVAGADLRRETRRQVLKSRKIVVIARAGAFRSEWVKREVAVALANGVVPVILNLNGAFEAAASDAPLAVMAREHDWLRLTETLDDPDGEPTDRIISELVRSFNHTRQETRRQRIFAAAAVVFSVTAIIASWQAVVANEARAVAEAQQARAQRALEQVVGTANRSVQSLALRVKKTRETSGEGQAVPPCDAAHFKAYDELATAALKGSDPDAALAALTNCLAIVEDRVTADPGALDWQWERAVLHQRIGDLSAGTKAEEHYRKAIVLWRKLAAEPSILPLAQRGLAGSLAKLGELELSLRKPEPALALFQESVSLLDRLASSNPELPDLQRALSVGYQQIADALLMAGKPEEALIWADKDLATYRTQPSIGNAEPGRQRDLASSYDRRAQALAMLGKTAEALDLYAKGTALLEAATAADNTQPSWQRDAAAMLENMGKLQGKMGQPDRAVDSFWRALSIREGLATSQEAPTWLAEVTEAYRRTSQFMRNIDRVGEALEMAEQYLLAASIDADSDKSKVTRIRRALGTVCWSAVNDGQFKRAVWAGKRAMDLSPRLDWVRLNYAHALMLSGEGKAAKEIYLEISSVSDEAENLKDQALKDFAELKRRGHVDPMMAEIRAQWGM